MAFFSGSFVCSSHFYLFYPCRTVRGASPRFSGALRDEQQAQDSPCPGAQGTVPSIAAATQGMVATFNVARATNMAMINQKASENVELQLLLL